MIDDSRVDADVYWELFISDLLHMKRVFILIGRRTDGVAHDERDEGIRAVDYDILSRARPIVRARGRGGATRGSHHPDGAVACAVGAMPRRMPETLQFKRYGYRGVSFAI